MFRILRISEGLSLRTKSYWKALIAHKRQYCAHDPRRIDSTGQQKFDELVSEYKEFLKTDSKSMLRKHLTQKVFDKLKMKHTSFKSTLLDCVQSGFANPDSNIGVYAPDAEAYSVFADLFDPIIEDYHNGFHKTESHPAKDFGDVNVFENLDPANKFVVSLRIRCGRAIKGYPFNPCLQKYQYTEIEQTVKKILITLPNELRGVYHPLCSMTPALKKELIDSHFLFKEGDRFLQAAKASRFWPLGRGIFINRDRTFLVWINEEDHIRIISMQKGGDIKAVYGRLVKAVSTLETRLNFSRHERLGFLTFCPTNLGNFKPNLNNNNNGFFN